MIHVAIPTMIMATVRTTILVTLTTAIRLVEIFIDGNSESSDKSNHTTNQNQSQNGNADMLFNAKQHMLMSCYM